MSDDASGGDASGGNGRGDVSSGSGDTGRSSDSGGRGGPDRIDPDVAGERFDPRSVQAIARKDFHDAIRSRGLLLLTAVFVVFFAAAAFFFADQFQSALDAASQGGNEAQARTAEEVRNQLDSDSFLQSLTSITRLLIPLVGIVVAYASVIGERESGTLKLLLSLPHSRLDVVLGKFVGRSAVLAVPVVAGFLVAMPAFPLAGVPLKIGNYVLFALLTVLLGLVFVAVALGASAAARTSRRAVIGTFVVYALFTLLWSNVTRAVTRQLREQTDLGQQALTKAFLAVQYLNPIDTYQSLTESLAGGGPQIALFAPPSRQQYVQQFGDLPIYLTDGALTAYLVLWVVVPVVLGYFAFELDDL
jgi:ABC-2 type transport system permease protein